MWVWVALPAYNGFLAPDDVRQRVVLNSFLGLMGSSGVSYLCSFVMCVHWVTRHISSAAHALRMYENGLPLQAIILGSISGGIALGTPFSPFLSPTWALLIGCFSGLIVAIWIKSVQPIVAKYSFPRWSSNDSLLMPLFP
jgi:hypothetical protein